MDPKIVELCDCLRTAAALLARVDQHGWAAWLDEARVRLERHDRSGIDRLLAAYGGMGSFNDLTIVAADGAPGAGEDAADADERLDILRSRMHALARALRDHPPVGDEPRLPPPVSPPGSWNAWPSGSGGPSKPLPATEPPASG